MRYISIALMILLTGCYQTPNQYQARPMYWVPPPPPQFQAPNFQRHNGTNCYPSGFGSISCYNY